MVDEVTKTLCALAEIMRQERKSELSGNPNWATEFLGRRVEAENAFMNALKKYVELLAHA